MTALTLCWWAVLLSVCSLVVLGMMGISPSTVEEKYTSLQFSNLLYIAALTFFASALTHTFLW